MNKRFSRWCIREGVDLVDPNSNISEICIWPLKIVKLKHMKVLAIETKPQAHQNRFCLFLAAA